MADLQGLALFPGVNQVVRASIGFVHGISPSVANLEILPQPNFIGQGGTLRFQFGKVNIDFPDCRVDYNSLQRNASGEIWSLRIFDRRWKWTPYGGGGYISGKYNVRMPNSLIKPGTNKKPRELAELCLKAMGETGYNIAELPNESSPEINWDYAVPAEALARLCDELGCRVVLGLNNRVSIRLAGKGAKLPSQYILENSLTIDPPEKPYKIAIVTGPIRYQADFLLEAVGLDRGTDLAKWPDQDIRPVNDLSYAPTGGYGNTYPPFFGTVSREVDVRELAMTSVFKWYRVKCSKTSPIKIPGYDTPITSIDQLNFENSQVATALQKDIGNFNLCLAPMVYGAWFDERYGLENITGTVNPATATNPESIHDQCLRRSFTFDAAHGIVRFAEPIFCNSTVAKSKLTIAPAYLRLRVACTINDPKTGALVRYARERQTGSRMMTPTRYIRHEEISPSIIPNYNKKYVATKLTHNKKEIDKECDYYLVAAMKDYQLNLPQTIAYSGLWKIDLDGAIQQVTFSIGTSGGATTTVSRNTEQYRYVDPYKERRMQEIQRETWKTSGQIVNTVSKVWGWAKELVGR
jgi:hypothetical protein